MSVQQFINLPCAICDIPPIHQRCSSSIGCCSLPGHSLPASLHQTTGLASKDLGRLVLVKSQGVVAISPIGPTRNADDMLRMVGL